MSKAENVFPPPLTLEIEIRSGAARLTAFVNFRIGAASKVSGVCIGINSLPLLGKMNFLMVLVAKPDNF
jgi:hypothetical protein